MRDELDLDFPEISNEQRGNIHVTAVNSLIK